MKTKTVTVRLPMPIFETLEKEVRGRRQKTGEAATKADVIREALEAYLKK
ncbi:MAG: hypothetical protein WD623_16900 [Marinobacter sp.]